MQKWKNACDKSSRTVNKLRWHIGAKLERHVIGQKELAELLGLHPTTISNYATKRRLPNKYVREKMINLAKEFDLDLSKGDFLQIK